MTNTADKEYPMITGLGAPLALRFKIQLTKFRNVDESYVSKDCTFVS